MAGNTGRPNLPQLSPPVAGSACCAPSGLAGAVWRYPRPDGSVGVTTGTVTSAGITVVLTVGCGVA
jgi:hypothetical protein